MSYFEKSLEFYTAPDEPRGGILDVLDLPGEPGIDETALFGGADSDEQGLPVVEEIYDEAPLVTDQEDTERGEALLADTDGSFKDEAEVPEDKETSLDIAELAFGAEELPEDEPLTKHELAVNELTCRALEFFGKFKKPEDRKSNEAQRQLATAKLKRNLELQGMYNMRVNKATKEGIIKLSQEILGSMTDELMEAYSLAAKHLTLEEEVIFSREIELYHAFNNGVLGQRTDPRVLLYVLQTKKMMIQKLKQKVPAELSQTSANFMEFN